MPNCAFLSISNTAGWFIDDDLVHDPLKRSGWEVQNIPWDKPTDWDAFDLVIIRSPWDYQDHLEQFTAVLRRIEASSATLLNGFDLVMWNIHKNYLFELESKGIELVPTIKTSTLKRSVIETAYEKFRTADLVIKPVIGANADDTFRISQKASDDLTAIFPIFRNRECLIQPFMPNIVDEGEYSLMYFQGELSHVILKTVADGDYRVQEEHGGGVIPMAAPEASLVSAGAKVMDTLSETPLYARVDLVRTTGNSFALMELELIEPCLYFRFDPESPQKFAQCIDEYWKSSKTVNRIE